MDASPSPPSPKTSHRANEAFHRFNEHSNKNRVATGLTILQALRDIHQDFHVTLVSSNNCDLLGYAGAGHAKSELDTEGEAFHAQKTYQAPSRRSEDSQGTLADHIVFGKYDYHWNQDSFIVYLAEWDSSMRGRIRSYYILAKRSMTGATSGNPSATDELILAASKWSTEVHEEIYIFDNGFWSKNKELWNSVQTSTWDDVILDRAMKKNLIDDIEGFFDRKDVYKQFTVPWKVKRSIPA